MKLMRAFAASSTLLLTSILAHILAGGDALSAHSLIRISLASAVIALFLIKKSDDPVRVTFAIFLAQNLGHFLLGGYPRSNEQMFLAHLLAGALSYHLLQYFEKNLPTLGSLVLQLLPPFLVLVIPTFRTHVRNPRFSYRSLATHFFAVTHSLRAPPLH